MTAAALLLVLLLLVVASPLDVAYDESLMDDGNWRYMDGRLARASAMDLCPAPRYSFERQVYWTCMRRHGLMSDYDIMLWNTGGGWKPVLVRW